MPRFLLPSQGYKLCSYSFQVGFQPLAYIFKENKLMPNLKKLGHFYVLNQIEDKHSFGKA